ncbi:MAG: LTA synthase family protein [Slackia sp.]|nr:LTA synthase family protein [Slackia sp.]
MEIPYNPALFQMEPHFVFTGLCVTGALFAIVFFLGQRSKAAMTAFLCACFIAGTANYFVASFKGQPVLPSDVMALQTAASVSGGYTYAIGSSVLFAFALLATMAAAIAVVSPSRPNVRDIAVDTSAGIAVLTAFCLWFCAGDIEEDYHCTVDVWSSLDSYQSNGSLLCFLQRSQLLTPKPPDGYSPEQAALIRNEKAGIALADKALDESPATAPDVRPAIVAIMNETFSDLSRYPGIGDIYDGPDALRGLDDALVEGDCYVSAMGGGTCNSEFEFLTGSSMGLLGAGIYPYMLYDLRGTDNLAGYLSSIGYKTSAIHPAQKENWRRDRVYAQLGFDAFYSEEHFEDTETFRGMVSDGATYDLILDLLAQDDAPQFIFDVTIAGHGGYDTNMIEESDAVHVEIGGMEYAEVNEYLACVKRADEELSAFLEQLRTLERPVIVCFFGDHQPGFVEWLSRETYGNAESDLSEIELIQERYVTPYMIWTNDEELRLASGKPEMRDTSLNYLGATLLRKAGLPLDEYFAFTLAMRDDIPAINLNGYQDAQGVWRWHGESSDSSEAYRQLSMVEHANLFEKE